MIERGSQFEPSIPNTETDDVFKPQFSFTTEIIHRMEAQGLVNNEYVSLARGLDQYLGDLATKKDLLAVGITAIPGSDPYMFDSVAEGGFVLKMDTYWENPPSDDEHETEWDNLGEKLGINDGESKISTGRFRSTFSRAQNQSVDDFLQRDFRDNQPNGFHMEDWGIVTTEDLRNELSQNPQ